MMNGGRIIYGGGGGSFTWMVYSTKRGNVHKQVIHSCMAAEEGEGRKEDTGVALVVVTCCSWKQEAEDVIVSSCQG